MSLGAQKHNKIRVEENPKTEENREIMGKEQTKTEQNVQTEQPKEKEPTEGEIQNIPIEPNEKKEP